MSGYLTIRAFNLKIRLRLSANGTVSRWGLALVHVTAVAAYPNGVLVAVEYSVFPYFFVHTGLHFFVVAFNFGNAFKEKGYFVKALLTSRFRKFKIHFRPLVMFACNGVIHIFNG